MLKMMDYVFLVMITVVTIIVGVSLFLLYEIP